MKRVSRRGVLGAGLAGSAGLLVAGCSSSGGSNPSTAAGSGGAAGGAMGPGGAGVGGAGGQAGSGAGAGGACASDCIPTADNIEGPFYTANAPFRTDIGSAVAGERLIVTGQVRGCAKLCGSALEDAVVDVWQADADGVYDGDGFTLRGRMRTNVDGRYELTTILPGEYDGRPKHIHYKVSHPFGQLLTTQMYFQGDVLNASDPWHVDSLTSPFVQENGVWRAEFDIVLEAA